MAAKIKLNDFEADVIRKSIKYIYLRICPPEGKLRISAPIQISTEKITKFVLSKLDWIKTQQKKFEIKPYKFITNETHYYRGRGYVLKIINNTNTYVELRDNKILLNIRPDSIIEERKSVIDKWYRNQLMLLIPPLIKKWENNLNVSVDNFFIRSMKTRWGSCTPKSRRIRFNLELAKASPDVLEYIVVHELMHLIEASHNRNFKVLMDQFYPNWKNIKKKLNNLNLNT